MAQQESMVEKSKAKAAQRRDDLRSANLAQDEKTQRLMADAAVSKDAAEEAARKKRVDDDARAEAESKRIAAERDAAVKAAREKAEREAADAEKDQVVVAVPKAFSIIDQAKKRHHYSAGTYAMPRAHALHWYARASGVRLAKDVVAAAEPSRTVGQTIGPKQKVLADAIDALPRKGESEDEAVERLRSAFGNDFTGDLEEQARAKF